MPWREAAKPLERPKRVPEAKPVLPNGVPDPKPVVPNGVEFQGPPSPERTTMISSSCLLVPQVDASGNRLSGLDRDCLDREHLPEAIVADDFESRLAVCIMVSSLDWAGAISMPNIPAQTTSLARMFDPLHRK